MRLMQKFYDNYDLINQFTLSLGFHQNELECAHCLKSDQFVSHGIVYKKRSDIQMEKVGKRIFCSNRYGRSGCGRTFQLYVASEIPDFQYGAAHLYVFIVSLLANMTIAESYFKAIKQDDLEPRNAWRWLDKLMEKLSAYRTFLKVCATYRSMSFKQRSLRLKHLLPSLASVISKTTDNPCSSFQLSQQNAFI